MPLIQADELPKTSNKITFIEANLNISNNYAYLDFSCEEFILFCEKHNITVVFYQYFFYEKSDYYISDEIIKNYSGSKEEFQFCKEWADKRNAELDSYDFERPGVLSLATSYNGIILKCDLIDEWLGENDIKAIEALKEFQEEHREIIQSFYVDIQDDTKSNLLEELTKLLLSDKSFRYCTSKENRRAYIQVFFKIQNNRKFLSLVQGERTKFDKEYRLGFIFDQIYNEYRGKCYKLKLQVGEPLPSENI